MRSSRQPELIRPNTFSVKTKLRTGGKSVMASTRTKVKPAPESKLWHVSKERLEKPNRRILDQTFQVIQNTDVDVITDRIVKVNKEMSVFAKYDNKKVIGPSSIRSLSITS